MECVVGYDALSGRRRGRGTEVILRPACVPAAKRTTRSSFRPHDPVPSHPRVLFPTVPVRGGRMLVEWLTHLGRWMGCLIEIQEKQQMVVCVEEGERESYGCDWCAMENGRER